MKDLQHNTQDLNPPPKKKEPRTLKLEHLATYNLKPKAWNRIPTILQLEDLKPLNLYSRVDGMSL